MQEKDNISEFEVDDQKIIENIELNIWEALIPVLVLVGLLAYNIFFADGEWLGTYSNQIILLLGGVVAAIVGFTNKVGISLMFAEIWENMKSVFIPIMILLLVGALAGTWLVSGIIPAMVYYGLQVLSPEIFLPASVVIAAIISIATGSSWTTSATVGIALIGIGTSALGIPGGMVAGAVISGAYFGDKMSPLSDTTNLAPAMAGTDLFTHIRYMAMTTVPTILITLVFFSVISSTLDTTGEADISGFLNTINTTFNITPWLFIVPLIVIVLIIFKTKPLVALSAGVLSAIVFAVLFQSIVLDGLAGSNFTALKNAVLTDTAIETDNEKLNDLFSSGGVAGMFWTILLIICAMVFGGVMDAIGALARITRALLKLAKSVFGLFASTVVSCLGLNIVASDQYLAIVIPGKMFKKAFDDRGLAPQNLSRTLEDSGTVTSVLIPWNTCGAYQSGVLGVSVADYFAYAMFNWLSPFTTLFFALFRIKIKMLMSKEPVTVKVE